VSDQTQRSAGKRQRGHRGQGTVYRRDGRPGWFRAIDVPTENGSRRRKGVWAPQKRQAMELLADVREKIRKGLPVDEDPPTVGDVLETWLSDVVETSKSPNTWKSYETKVRLYLAPRQNDAADGPYLGTPQLGGLRLATLKPRHVQAAVKDWQKAGKPPKAIRYAVTVLQVALSHAERLELVARNVAGLVVLPQAEVREIEPLNRRDVDAFLSEIVGHRLEALFRVALALGIREGEALGLRHQDVDLVERIVRIRV
jgi:integrase